MALIHVDFFSRVLGKETHATVMLPSFSNTYYMTTPQEALFDPGRRFKTLTLLHGFSQNETSWQRFSSAERYAERYGLAIVCPDGNNGHYTDWAVGPQNLTFLQEEFLPALRTIFPLSPRQEDNFVGGLSMGGYGAFKWAFTYPDTFSHVINFSGGVDIRPRIEFYKFHLDPRQMEQVFGPLDQVPDGPHDVFRLIRDVKKSGHPLPRIFSCSGTEDKAGFMNHTNLLKVLEEVQADVTVYTAPGHHDFWFWDEALKKVISEWLPLTDLQEGLDLP